MRAPAPVEIELVGREREAARLEALMRPTGARFVVIRGDVGIGKTALWRWAVAAHRAAGHRVLVTRPAEEELHGPMTGLIDLFDDVVPAPGTLDPDVDLFDRGRAVLRTLRHLARDAPVVVAIDDLQWLDAITARSLRYAARRLDAEAVVILATERSTAPVGVVPPDRGEELIVGPLSSEAIVQLVRTVVGTLPRPTRERIAELSAGNPMYAIELAQSSAARGDRLGTVTPPTLRGVLASRLGDVPDDVLAVLRTAAALGPAPAALLDRACAAPGAATRLHDAVDEGLLVAGDDGMIRFAHPLLASVVLDGTNPLERKALHAALAAVVTDPDARARHLALSCSEADDAIAAALEASAERAARRGAAAAAADLAEHSVRLTPPADVDAATRRTLAAVSYRAAAGEPDRALTMADELLGRLDAGQGRLEAITLRVFLDIDHSEEILARAIGEAGNDDVWRGRLLELLGWVLGTYRGQLANAITLGEQALAIARSEQDQELEMLAAATLSTAALLAGRPVPALMDRALSLAELHEPPRLGRWPQLFRARHCLWGGELGEARQRFEATRLAFAERGVEFQRPYRLNDLAWVETLAGNLRSTIELTDDALEAALDAGSSQAAAWHSYPAGLACAHLGRHDVAREAAASLRTWAVDHDQPPRLLMGLHLLGLVALAGGDAAAAATELQAARSLAAQLGYRHPGYVPYLSDAVEAAALAGDADGCQELVAELDDQAAALGLPWVDAAAQRGHGLAALVAGAAAAADELGAAADAFDAIGYRLDAARAQLLRGRALRRSGRRTEAATVLADAHARFSRMGAEPWAAQATAEIERVAPGRRAGNLTVTESKIAELVVLGRRNREIAGELLISVATVEAHLTRMYRKLGVRSRTELARFLAPER